MRQWASRGSALRPSPRPLRVLDPRRRLPDPRARRARGGARDARGRAHRPRLARGRRRALPRGAASRASSRSSAARSTSPTTAIAQEKGYAHLTLLAETNEGYANLIKLSSLGYLEGYYYKPRVDWELLERHAAGLVALSGCLSGRVSQGARGEPARATPPPSSTGSSQIFGRDSTYVEIQNAGLDAQARINPQLAELAADDRPAARRHRRRPLPPPRGRARARGAALHPVRRLAEEPEPLEVRHRPVLLQDARRRWRSTSRRTRRRSRARSRSPSAATSRSSSGSILLPKFPTPDGRDAFEYLVELCEEGLARRYDDGDPGAPRAAPVRAEDDPRDGLRRLLPDRLGLRPLREAERHQRRARPRLGGRLARRVLPRDHRRRPDALRAALRALPQPGPQGPCRTWTSTSPSPAATG